MSNRYDIAIVGSGFAGSLMAMILRRLGHSVVMIERGTHPRVVIGESSTPLTNLLLDELATRYDLPAIKPLTKWGSWQHTYPEIACGLKRGFTFYHHDRHTTEPPDRSRQLLVAASPYDEIADTHWYRADFDHLLLRQAVDMGVDYHDQTEIASLTQLTDGIDLVTSRHDARATISARFLIDASGPRGFLHKVLGLKEHILPDYPHTQALYSHFTGVERLDNTRFGANDQQPPYPIDDAAVHHVFDGGWVWVLRFNNGVTSAGVAARNEVASDLCFIDGEAAWHRLLQKMPALQEQFTAAKPSQSFTYIPRLSFCSATVCGDRWAMLPSAAGFVDPLLSTGFPLTLLGVSRLADTISRFWDSDKLGVQLNKYAARTQAELSAVAQLIGALYANMYDFPVFTALSLIYFAAVSYSETVCRLGKPELAPSFLLYDHPVFGPAVQKLTAQSRLPRSGSDSSELVKRIIAAIEPFNVAGLGDPCRRNWYPVEATDLLNSASKVGASRQELAEMLRRSGFDSPALTRSM
jgi:tetracycline 7-halogenase / FADH2 O2-dependent halogenase